MLGVVRSRRLNLSLFPNPLCFFPCQFLSRHARNGACGMPEARPLHTAGKISRSRVFTSRQFRPVVTTKRHKTTILLYKLEENVWHTACFEGSLEGGNHDENIFKKNRTDCEGTRAVHQRVLRQ